MVIDSDGARRGFCGLCIARCGTIATVENGRFTRLDPDPDTPDRRGHLRQGPRGAGARLHKDRLTQPLRRTPAEGRCRSRLGGDLLGRGARSRPPPPCAASPTEHGPQAVAFSQSSPSTTAIADSGGFVRRLMNAFGTPNLVWALDLCGWGRGFATRYVFGVGSVATGSAGGAMADIANAGCLILWGYNPRFRA